MTGIKWWVGRHMGDKEKDLCIPLGDGSKEGNNAAKELGVQNWDWI